MLAIYDQKRDNIFGNPDCCNKQTGKCKEKRIYTYPSGDGQNVIVEELPCSQADCLGRMGQVLKEYREAVRACCTTICIGNIDDQGIPIPPPSICGNLPLDPEKNCNKRWHGPVPPSEIVKGPRKKVYPGLYDADKNPIYHGPQRKGIVVPPGVDPNVIPPINRETPENDQTSN
jgi:hypothetical protein